MQKLKALWKKDPGLFVSASVHALAFACLVVNFAWPPKLVEETESIPIEMVSESDLNQIATGEKNAKQMPTPQRRVDKVAEVTEHKPAPPLAEAKKDTPTEAAPEKPNDDPGKDEKPTEAAAAPPPPPPPPVPTPPERPVEKAEAPTPPPKPEAVKPPPPPPDAEAVEAKPPPRPKIEPPKEAKETPKPVPMPRPRPPERKVAKVVPPEPPKKIEPVEKPEPKKTALDQVASLLASLKPPKPVTKARSGNDTPDAPKQDTFSLDKISALLDHEAPQRRASTGAKPMQTASLGSPTSHAEKMSPSMMARIDGWLIDHYRGCWSYFGLGATQDYVPKVHVVMAPDGSLIGTPSLLNPPTDPNLRSLADSAIRAVNRCNPMPVPDWLKAHYEAWRDRSVRFDPKELS